jgi:hypothetical protein
MKKKKLTPEEIVENRRLFDMGIELGRWQGRQQAIREISDRLLNEALQRFAALPPSERKPPKRPARRPVAEPTA